MGAFIFIGLFVVSVLTGLIVEQRTLNAAQEDGAPDATSDLTAYLSYKKAVQAYVFAHPSTSGSVALADLPSSDVQGATSAMKNMVLRTGSSSEVVTWWETSSQRLDGLLAAAEGDRAIGISNGQSWQTPAGGDMGPLPVPVPAGDIVSFVIFTGSGF